MLQSPDQVSRCQKHHGEGLDIPDQLTPLSRLPLKHTTWKCKNSPGIARSFCVYHHKWFTDTIRNSTSSHDPTLIDVSPKPPSRSQDHKYKSPLAWFSLCYQRFKALQGYHFGVMCCAVVASIVAILNIVFLAWGLGNSDIQGGLGTLHDGSCHKTNTLTRWLHLVINVLGTLLLGASNYTMQCLSAPTRVEIDKAHGKGIWLDIGVPSLRNLRRMSALRFILWSLIAISSVPLHLLYNSAVFSTLTTRQYNVFLVSDNFFDGATFNLSTLLPYGGRIDGERVTFSGEDLQTTLENYQINTSSLTRLDNEACVKAYSANIISSRADVILVSSTTAQENSVLAIHPVVNTQIMTDSTLNSRGWMCAIPATAVYCREFQTVKVPDTWSVNISSRSSGATGQSPPIAASVQYCLSQPVQERCKFQFSLPIMVVVISCNLIKAICMGFMAWKRDKAPLVTLGDAIASFLDQPDPTTEGNCAVGKSRFKKSKVWDRYPSQWTAKPVRWFRAASLSRWAICSVL